MRLIESFPVAIAKGNTSMLKPGISWSQHLSTLLRFESEIVQVTCQFSTTIKSLNFTLIRIWSGAYYIIVLTLSFLSKMDFDFLLMHANLS